MNRACLFLAITLSACSSSKAVDQTHRDTAHTSITISVIGTSDVHGALDRLPIFAGFVANLRAARAHGGAVVLLDGGDMFQGTLESNINEGEAVIDVYNAIGYTAAVIGNHEFDFGPVGEASTPRTPEDNPRGALFARLKQAQFPILSANYLDESTGKHVAWDDTAGSILHETAGLKIGIIGVSTWHTPQVTMASNIVGVKMAPLANTIVEHANALRARGASIVLVTAHAGGRCSKFDVPDDLSSCDRDEEIVHVANALPAGLVDVIVGGHTHQAMAHRVNGIAIVQSYARGRAFGRVDLQLSPNGEQGDRMTVTQVTIHPPRNLCQGKRHAPVSECKPGDYEGAPVVADARIAALIAPRMQAADSRKKQPLGVNITAALTRGYIGDSPLGNVFADLMREALGTDVGVTNSGGLRADIPVGPLDYGSLYEAMPFDNRFVTVTMTASDIARMLTGNLRHASGSLLISGIRAIATCRGDALSIEITDERGTPIPGDRRLTVATSDFLSTGDKSPFGRLGLPPNAFRSHDEIIRDALADVLKRRGGDISGADKALMDADNPRVRYPGERPVRCDSTRSP